MIKLKKILSELRTKTIERGDGDDKRGNRELIQLNKLYATLSQMNQTIVRVHDQDTLFRDVCSIAVAYGRFQLAWIGLLQQESVIRPVAASGKEHSSLNGFYIDLSLDQHCNTFLAKAFLEGRLKYSQDFSDDSGLSAWNGTFEKLGCHSCATVPIRQDSKVIGIFNVFAAGTSVFQKKELQLIEEIGLNISFALDRTAIENHRNLVTQELRESEKRFHSTLDHMLEGCQIINKDWIYLYINHAAEVHNRRSKEELLGRKYMDMWPGIEKLKVFRVLDQCMREREVQHMENEFIYPDGKIAWFELHIQPVPEGIFILSLDITERKLAEETIRESEQKFRNLFENLPVGISMTSIDGSMFVNDAFGRMLGYEKSELAQMNWMDLSKLDEVERINEMVQPLMSGQYSVIRLEKQYLHKNGSLVWCDLSSYLQRDRTGAPLFFITAAVDITERKQTEAELQESREKYSVLFEKAAIPAALTKLPENTFVDVNRAFEKLFKFTKDELIGKTSVEVGIVRKEDQEHTRQELLHSRTALNQERWFYTRSEEKRTVGFNVSRVEMGGSSYAITTVQDITERREAEERLKISQATLSLFVEYAPASIAMFDREMKYLAFSRRYIADYHLTRNDLVGHSHYEIFPEIPERWKEIHRRCLEGAVEKAEEDPFLRDDGRTDWVRWEIRPWYEHSGVIGGILLFSEVITQRKLAEEALAESEEKYRTLIEVSIDAIFVNERNRISFVNKAAIGLFGADNAEQIIGSSPLGFFDPAYHDLIRQRIDNLLHHKPIDPLIEIKLIRLDGAPVDVEVAATAFRFNGNPAILVILRDITERKRIENSLKENQIALKQQNEEYLALNEELSESNQRILEINRDLLFAKEQAQESDRLKTAFLHNISHEIRTPMNAIVGFSEFLKNPMLSLEKRVHFTDIIIQSSNQLLSIITDIVNIATIEAGQEKVSENTFSINQLLRVLHEQFILKARKIPVSLEVLPGLPENRSTIVSDERKLTEVLSNLVGNALKFTKTGYVRFGYTPSDEYLQFFVEDTGIGIPLDMHAEIFKRFHQADSSMEMQLGGSGLGLSISKAYVEMMGGSIWLHSVPGKGSVFNFTIPFRQVTETDTGNGDSPERVEDTDRWKKYTFLIVEDNDSNFKLLEEILHLYGARIRRAVNGREAVDICRSDSEISLVLMDLKLPGMDGYEASRQIRERLPQLPIIAQTAYTSDFDRAKAVSCGIDDYITKPVQRNLLIQKLKVRLEH